MITKITIGNFRAVEGPAELPVGPITVLYGATSSGKSTALYAPLLLRNFALNPNRAADAFFGLGFMDLGGFDACVFNHEGARKIRIAVESRQDDVTTEYEIELSKSGAELQQSAGSIVLREKVPIPYGLNQNFVKEINVEQQDLTINWNGIACTVAPKQPSAASQEIARHVAVQINQATEALKAIDVAPHRRGFFKPSYTPVGASQLPTTEDEVASLIINDPNMAGLISAYAEEIFGRDFRLHIPPGTATAFFQTTDKKARSIVNLVNEGFGVNQIVYLLAKMCRPETGLLLIEEPEVHLHPTLVRNFVRVLCSWVKEERKQVMLATHSEQFLISLLTAVSEKLLKAEDLSCLLASKSGKRTEFKQQRVSEDGQVEGGLASFMEGEMKDLKSFLKDK